MTPPGTRHGTEYAISLEPQLDHARIVALPAACFETLVDGVALYDRAGAMLLANQSMRRARTIPLVRHELDLLRNLLLERACMRSSIGAGEVTTRQLVIGTHSYQLRGARVNAETARHDEKLAPAFCVTLHEGPRALPSEVELRARFHFTPCEARVALQLAEGRSNKEIATALQVSIHTVRHHAEHVFAKMAVESRAGVAWELLRE